MNKTPSVKKVLHFGKNVNIAHTPLSLNIQKKNSHTGKQQTVVRSKKQHRKKSRQKVYSIVKKYCGLDGEQQQKKLKYSQKKDTEVGILHCKNSMNEWNTQKEQKKKKKKKTNSFIRRSM